MFRSLLALVLVGAFAAPRADAAPLTLTPAGAALGFTLSTFADQFPNNGTFGPFGIGFTPGGGVLVSDYFGNVRLFPSHADGQHAPAAPVGGNYGTFSSLAITNIGSDFYLATHSSSTVARISTTGAFIQTVATGIPIARDLAVNPANGHLFVSGQDGIWDLNPATGAKTLKVSGQTDGLSLAGNILYAARGFNGSVWNTVQGFDINTFALVFNSGLPDIPGIDGVVVGNGSLSGYLFANTNFGEVWRINLANPSDRLLLANGGSRGDFVVVDPTNGTLLLTQTDRIVRLTAPAGGGFGTAAVPEPATLAVVGLLGLSTLALRRRRTKVA